MRIGVIAGNFDAIHPGYIHMFNECKKYCNYLIVLLHEDPTNKRPEKLKPILSVEERLLILYSLKQVNLVMTYKTEEELYNLCHFTNLQPMWAEENLRKGSKII